MTSSSCRATHIPLSCGAAEQTGIRQHGNGRATFGGDRVDGCDEVPLSWNAQRCDEFIQAWRKRHPTLLSHRSIDDYNNLLERVEGSRILGLYVTDLLERNHARADQPL
jgi:hypothetical protein